MSLVAIQAALDRLNFSPNCIDGTDGPQTRLAIEAWQIRQGVTPTGVLSPEQARQLVGETPPLTTRTVTAEDLASLGPTPSSWTGKASLERLAYGTLLEALAESAHARESLLRKLNPDLAWPNPPAGAAVRVPRSEDEMPQRTAARLTVSLRHKHIRAFDREGRLIAHFPCSIAAKVEKRPRGEARVTTAADGPNYTFDPALFSEDPAAAGIGRRLIIPPGPNNPVGVAWIGLNLPGYGIHGTPKPEEIGKTESHGCFRLANWNARRLLKLVEPGTPVEITD
jgi:lipoprotein-anchoring transpeptidase ErfK/SrfK